MATLQNFEQGKQAKPVILANNQAIIVWRIDGALYCTDANSTAFQYPIVDGKISSRGFRRRLCPIVHVLADVFLMRTQT